jgi:hypothetical protein
MIQAFISILVRKQKYKYEWSKQTCVKLTDRGVC